MRYLAVNSAGEIFQTDEGFQPDDHTAHWIEVDGLTLIRFTTSGFEYARVHAQDDSRSIEWVPIEEYFA